MNDVRFSMRGSKLTDAVLQDLMEGCAVRIPDDYKEFLLEFNGGKPQPSGMEFLTATDSDGSIGNESLLANLEAELLRTHDPLRQRELEEDREFVRNTLLPRRVSMLFGAYTSPLGLRKHLSAASRLGAAWVEQLIPIGEDDSGGLIFLSLADDFGSVYAFLPEYDDTAEGCEQFRIAVSFTAFLNRLVPARIVYSSGYAPTERHVKLFRLNEYDE